MFFFLLNCSFRIKSCLKTVSYNWCWSSSQALNSGCRSIKNSPLSDMRNLYTSEISFDMSAPNRELCPYSMAVGSMSYLWMETQHLCAWGLTVCDLFDILLCDTVSSVHLKIRLCGIVVSTSSYLKYAGLWFHCEQWISWLRIFNVFLRSSRELVV